MAKLDDAKLKVDPPAQCAVGVSARASVMAAGCGGSGPKENPDGSYEHLDGKLEIKLDKDENKWANDQLAKAKAKEPEITDAVLDVRDRTGGMRMGEGKEVKSAESYKRKLYEELQPDKAGDPRKTVDQVAGDMNDSVRYTLAYETKDYSTKVLTALTELEKRFELVKLKNFWKRNMDEGGVTAGYPGINVTFRGPDGVLFEVQFHTPEGIVAKALETPNYESRRSNRAAQKVIENDTQLSPQQKADRLQSLKEEYDRLEAKRKELWADVPRPVGSILIDEKGV